MRLSTQLLLSAGLAICDVGLVGSEESPPIQSFVDFCAYKGANLTDNHWLGASCRNNMTDVFGYGYTWINLDLCVGNNGSQLIAYENGNFSMSCAKCTTNSEKKTLMLTCSCQNSDRGYSTSSLDLNTTIYNDNGGAGCFGHLGNKTQFGPEL